LSFIVKLLNLLICSFFELQGGAMCTPAGDRFAVLLWSVQTSLFDLFFGNKSNHCLDRTFTRFTHALQVLLIFGGLPY